MLFALFLGVLANTTFRNSMRDSRANLTTCLPCVFEKQFLQQQLIKITNPISAKAKVAGYNNNLQLIPATINTTTTSHFSQSNFVSLWFSILDTIMRLP